MPDRVYYRTGFITELEVFYRTGFITGLEVFTRTVVIVPGQWLLYPDGGYWDPDGGYWDPDGGTVPSSMYACAVYTPTVIILSTRLSPFLRKLTVGSQCVTVTAVCVVQWWCTG